MRLVVVDPRILIRAFAHPRSAPARLLALFAYGRVAMAARGYAREEVEEMMEFAGDEDGELDLDFARQWAEREVAEARWRAGEMEDAFGQIVTDQYLLAVSPPLLADLVDEAQRYQGEGYSHVHPDRVRLHAVRHSAKTLLRLGVAPNYLAPGQVSRYDYLIHTGVEAEARDLVTDDPILQLPGSGTFVDGRTRREVTPYSLAEFIADLPSMIDLDRIDAEAVLRAAVKRRL